jgi:plasmid stability protein
MAPLQLHRTEDAVGVNLSIKSVPEAWAERLRLRAERNHRSLQGELMAIVEQAWRRMTQPPCRVLRP